MGRRTWAAALAGSVLALSAVASGPAAADGGQEQTLLMVLDASGSMRTKLPDGTTRISAARASLNRAIDRMPESTRVGMRVYGGSVPDDKGKKAQCADSELVVPIGTDNRDALRGAVKKYTPLGETPIAYSLGKAATDLPKSGNRTILLVSDGEETCAPDPCPAAEKLAGIDLRIDVIGVDVNSTARKQLRCIAEKGNGRYVDARSSKDLDFALSRLSERAFRPFSLTGTAVAGVADVAVAPEIGVGNWVDTAPAAGSVGKSYRFRRTVPGSTLWVGLAFTNPTDLTGTRVVALDVLLSDGEGLSRCDGATASAFGGSGIGSAQGLFSALVTSFGSSNADCDTTDELVVTVAPNMGADLEGHPVQLRVYEEPPVADARGLPEPTEPVWEPMKPGKAADAPTPGSSFDDAPTLDPGTYSIDVVPGEIAVYQVPVGWGQRLQAQLDSPGFTSDDRERVGLRTADLELIGPFGGDARILGTGAGGGNRLMLRDKEAVGVSTRTIAYRHRAAAGASRDQEVNGLPGNVRVVINVTRDASDPEVIPWAIPLTLTVRVIGEEAGAPTYVLPTVAIPTASGPSPSPTAPTTVDQPDSTSASSPANLAPTKPSDGRPPWPLIGSLGGAVVLVAAVAAAWAGRAHRPR
ncbi:MAG TPA: VWA domain-containing protein [Arachnia sp.]|jgi:Ca-activated chloride channel family protein|nr:VWA domain-containing protein [Propionibacteriaceae bacterium]HQD22784.1 VWA domain-containing protein [Arachnia sp.]